jgi:imidazolonepropionase-like amidohydrolase
MKNRVHRTWTGGRSVFLSLVLLSGGVSAAPSDEPIYVLSRRIYAGDRHAVIENGGMLIRDGRIVRLDKKAKPPKDARIIDARERTIIPGLIDAHAHLGFGREDLNFDAAPSPAWRAPLPDSLKPYYPVKKAPAPPKIEVHFRAGSAVFYRDTDFRRALAEGVTLSKVAIPTFGPVGGISACVRTGASGPADFLVNDRVAVEYSFAGSENVMLSQGNLRKLFRDARDYGEKIRKARTAPGTNQARGAKAPPEPDPAQEPPGDENLDAAREVLEGRMPLMIRADKENEILAALEIKDEFRIKLVLVGAGEMSGMVGDLVSRKVPVILDPRALLDDAKDGPEAVKRLLASGIPVALGSGTGSAIEFFRFALLLLVQEGLDRSDVLDMASVHGAKILGMEDRVGSLAPGREADFVVMSGDPFDLETHVEQVFINGRRVYER